MEIFIHWRFFFTVGLLVGQTLQCKVKDVLVESSSWVQLALMVFPPLFTQVENLYWLSVFENYIYATNLENRNVEQNGTVIRIHRFNSSDYQVLSRVLHGGALHIYHSRRQPTGGGLGIKLEH